MFGATDEDVEKLRIVSLYEVDLERSWQAQPEEQQQRQQGGGGDAGGSGSGSGSS